MRATLATCQAAEPSLEAAYLSANRHLERMQQSALEQQRRLQQFSQELRFVGSEAAPQTWSHLGWSGEQPVALSRDRGTVMLIAGVPGAGKTVLSTVIAEGGLWAGAPLASAHL